MNEMFGNLGNNPKFNTLVKLAFYSLFLFAALILINTTEVAQKDEDNESDNNNNDVKVSRLITLPDSYEYSYNINIDDNIYSYQGIIEENNHTIKKNKDNKITNYNYKDGKYYTLNKDDEVEVLEKDVYDIVDYDYLKIEKINQYLANAEESNGSYLIYLKDSITGEDTDIYIKIDKYKEITKIDYSNLEDNYQKFVVEFQFKDRKDKGESDENEKE